MRFWWKNGFRLKVRKMGFNVQPVSSKKENENLYFFAQAWNETEKRMKKANKRQRDQIEFIFPSFSPTFLSKQGGRQKRTFTSFPPDILTWLISLFLGLQF
jgi:hypothetical protein